MNRNLQVIIAILLSVALLGVAVFIITYEPKKKQKDVEISTNSEIVTTDPVKTASLYIAANGTMGELSEVNEETLATKEATNNNAHIRMTALAKVREATIPGSILITGKEENNIKQFINSLDNPRLYAIENVKATDSYNERKISIYSEIGPTEYEAVDVDVSFDSIIIMFTAPSDTSYDGTYTKIENRETYEVTATLVKSGDLWFMYDIKDSEHLLNERFATWSGVGSLTFDLENNEETGQIKISGIELQEGGKNGE